MSAPEDAVTQDEAGWTFTCPGFAGDPCNNWSSSQWPNRDLAVERGREHFASHTDLIPTSSLDEFRDKHGVSVNEQGQAVVA